MGALSNYLESGLINHVFRGVSFLAPSTLYIGLAKSLNSGNLELGNIDEASGGGYQRQSYSANASNWILPYTSGSATATHNLSAIEFSVATANIGTVSGIFISDSSTSGNLLFYGALSYPRDIREGDQFVFSSGSLRVTLD
jgi:hypothetical protein